MINIIVMCTTHYQRGTIKKMCLLSFQDWLGLQQMDRDKKLHFLTADGDHLQFTDEFFDEQILPFLKQTQAMGCVGLRRMSDT